MSILMQLWRRVQFQLSLRKGKTRQAEQLLQEIERVTKLNWVEELFKSKLTSDRYLHSRNLDVEKLNQKLNELFKKIEYLQEQLDSSEVKNKLVNEQYLHRQNLDLELNQKLSESLIRIEQLQDQLSSQPEENKLPHSPEFIDYIHKVFKLTEHDQNLLQCTGIDERIFDDFEAKLVIYLTDELNNVPSKLLSSKMQEAIDDINGLKQGQDPEYGYSLTPHVYFMKYFLENVYCSYLAWFLIYENGLLPTKLNILDIAAGPGTVAYGLALLLKSSSDFLTCPQIHACYHSLEKQAHFQYRGLQFWRQYIESQPSQTNTYIRFDTTDIFDWNEKDNKISESFFDFIVVSHCFFSDPVKRVQANYNYKQIIRNSLTERGYVLLIIQDKKLFDSYTNYKVGNQKEEKKNIEKLVSELEVELVWYKLLKSSDSRKSLYANEFRKFAAEQLPVQNHMSSLIKQYFNINYDKNYTLDDYVILAKRKD